MPKAQWKRIQEQLALSLQALRQPLEKGRRSRLENSEIVAVVRHRAKTPDWLLNDMAQAILSAGGGRTPFVVLTTDAGTAYMICLIRRIPEPAPEPDFVEPHPPILA